MTWGAKVVRGVSGRLGHSSVRYRQVYSHAVRGQDVEAARGWEGSQGRNSPETDSEPAGQMYCAGLRACHTLNGPSPPLVHGRFTSLGRRTEPLVRAVTVGAG